ncbi:MAG: hypothetical protein AAGK05_19565, partial [Pseudomonadota bacterium]
MKKTLTAYVIKQSNKTLLILVMMMTILPIFDPRIFLNPHLQVKGRDGTTWNLITSNPHTAGRAASHNVFTASPGCRPSVASSISCPYDAWKHFIDEPMLR